MNLIVLNLRKLIILVNLWINGIVRNMKEIIEPNREMKYSIYNEVVVNNTTLSPSLFKEVKREVEKYECSSD